MKDVPIDFVLEKKNTIRKEIDDLKAQIAWLWSAIDEIWETMKIDEEIRDEPEEVEER